MPIFKFIDGFLVGPYNNLITVSIYWLQWPSGIALGLNIFSIFRLRLRAPMLRDLYLSSINELSKMWLCATGNVG